MIRTDPIQKAIHRLDNWVLNNSYKGYDPFDGLGSPLFRWIKGHGKLSDLMRTLIQQIVLRSPMNLRPWLGIHPNVNYKAIAYFAMAYLNLSQFCENQLFIKRAIHCLNWLEQHATHIYSGLAWSNTHDYQSRLFYLPKGVPTVVGTAHVARAFLLAYKTLCDEKYLHAARSMCDFILQDLPRHVDSDGFCISYIPIANIPVHNANMLAAAVLMNVYQFTQETLLLNIAHQAVQYTVKYQQPDGSWYYGEALKLRWIDNFHTGYILDALKTCINCGLDDVQLNEVLKRGNEYFINHFFGPNGEPWMYSKRQYPIDIQGAAQSIETLCYQRDHDKRFLLLAKKVSDWTINNMQAPEGYFYFRVNKWGMNNIPHIHWGQATMMVALTSLVEACNFLKN